MKGLVRHELRNIRGVGLVWLVAILGVSLLGYITAEEEFSNYIKYWRTVSFEDIFRENITWYFGVVLIGVMVLSFNQFKSNKSEGVGDFLAALPYTQKQVYQIKLGVGFLLITSIHLIYSLAITSIWLRNKAWLGEIERIHLTISRDSENAFFIVVIILLGSYLTMLIAYLFMYLLQYLIYPTFSGILIGILVIGAVPYTLLGIYLYMQEYLRMNTGYRWTEELAETFLALFIPNMNDEFYLINSEIVDFAPMGWKLCFAFLAITFLLLSIDSISQMYGIGKQTRFIISDAFEWVFKIGVSVCSGVFVIYLWMLFGYSRHGMIRVELVVVGVGVIGYFIARKITQIGKQ